MTIPRLLQPILSTACLVLILVPGMLAAAEPAPAGASTTSPALTTTATGADDVDVDELLPGYKLYPGDLVKVDVFDNPELSVSLRVPNEGAVSFPLIGDLEGLSGKSINDLRREITRRLNARYVINPIVTLTATEFGKRTVFVMGSVRLPAAVDLSPLSTMTAIQAIGQAGGFNDDADRTSSIVLRRDPKDANKVTAMPIPPRDKADSLVNDVILDPNDVIIVPRLDRVYVIGVVNRPGAFPLPTQEVVTLSKALSIAGGFDKYAKQSEVQLIRAGTVQTIDVDAVLQGKSSNDPELKPGDTVYVPESRF